MILSLHNNVSHTNGSINYLQLTHWGRVTHICVSKLAIIGSDNGLSPGRRQAIIWTNTGILLIRTLGINFSEILGEIHSFSSKKMHFKMSSAKGRLFSLGLNELMDTLFPNLATSPATRRLLSTRNTASVTLAVISFVKLPICYVARFYFALCLTGLYFWRTCLLRRW